MPKHSTFPTFYNELNTISVSDLKKWEYLEPNTIKSGTLTWSRNGHTVGSIGILVNFTKENPYLELDYSFREEPTKYRIPLVNISSNLGKGKIWYFQCPHTQKRCRKLYRVERYFLHREAFEGCMYECQSCSKKDRNSFKVMKSLFALDSFVKNGKQWRRYYNGKPTKRYLKYLALEHKASSAFENFKGYL